MNKTLHLTKVLAASRQVHFAIQALRSGDYDVAVTLAGAAEGMLPEIEGQPLFSRLASDKRALSELNKKTWLQVINWERDWLKHPTAQFPGTLNITLADAAFMVVRALTKLPQWSDEMEAFKVWYMEYIMTEDAATDRSRP